jgi:hypothetical protein
MEKLTMEAVDKAVEMLKELGVSDAVVESVKKELDAKAGGAEEPKANPFEKKEGDKAEEKEMEFSIGGDGKDTL